MAVASFKRLRSAKNLKIFVPGSGCLPRDTSMAALNILRVWYTTDAPWADFCHPTDISGSEA